MIDHMLFNLKKYYQSDTPNCIGKTLHGVRAFSIQPYQIDISFNSGVPQLLAGQSFPNTMDPISADSLNGKKIYGQAIFNNATYVLTTINYQNDWYSVWFDLNSLIQNGGVSASLNHVYHALTAFRSEVKSMIDHLLINLKKYYEGNEKNYIGKTINGVQNSIAAFSYTPSCDKNNSGFNERFERYDSFKSDFLNGIRIIGQATLQNGDILLMIPADYSGGYNQSLFVKLTDILKNGGVSSSLLTHVYHAFILARKELSMALMKMKYQLKDWYQGITQNYIGRSVTLPKTKIRFYDIQNTNTLVPSGSYTDCQNGKLLGAAGTIAGQAVVDGETLVSISWPFQFDYDNVDYTYVKLSDILQNGGVSSSPLTHLYQAFRGLLRKQVVVC